MKTQIRSFGLLCVLLAAGAGEAVSANYNVTVDLSSTGSPVTQRATGFLFGVSGTEPARPYFEPLKPGLVRFDAALGNPNFRGPETGFASSLFMNRIKATGAKMQVIISDEYQWVNNYHNIWGWPGDPASGGYTSFQLLDLVINNLMDAAALSYPASNGWQIEWDIWNEPDYPVFWGRDQAQFFQTWKHAVELIRSRDPNAVIVGPSVSQYNTADSGKYIKDFLIFARDNNVLPNVLIWHDLYDPSNLSSTVADIRNYMAANGIPNLPIDLNEYVGDAEWVKPGKHVRYMAELERAGVRHAAHAVWDEVAGDYWSNGLQPGNLCHLMTLDSGHSPRAAWQLYKAYADLSGTMINVPVSGTIDSLVAKETSGPVRMIFGNDAEVANTSSVTINRLDLLPYFASSGVVRVVVEKILNTGTAMQINTTPVSVTSYSPGGNSLVIPLSFGAQEILLVRLEDFGSQAAAPASYTIAQGSYGSGTIAGTVSNDNSYLVVKSQTSGTTRYATTDFTVNGLLAGDVSKLEFVAVTKSTKASTIQKISLWNYATAAWVEVDSVTIGTAEQSRSVSVKTNASNYLSGGTAKVRISASKTSQSFSLSTELLRVVAAPPEPVAVDNFSFEAAVGGSEYTNWATATWGIYPYTAPTLVPTDGIMIAYTNTAGGLMYQTLDSYALATGDKVKVQIDFGWPALNAWAGGTVSLYSVGGPGGTVLMGSFAASQPPPNGWNTLTMNVTATSQQAGGNLQIAIYGINGIQTVVDNVRVSVAR